MNILYYILYGVGYLISLLPLTVLYLFSDLLFYLVYYIIRYRRKIVRKNLTSAFPNKDAFTLLRIEKNFYHWFCDYIVETIKMFSASKEWMQKHMTFSGIDEMAERMQKEDKNFCFLYLGHYCNWEWIASFAYWAPDWMSCTQIYHPLYSKAFDKLFLKIRSQYGGENIPMKEALRTILLLRQKKQKTIIGFISDQAPKWSSIHHFTEFLNHDTPFFIGAEKIGKKVDALIYYADVKWISRGYYHCDYKFVADDIKDIPDYQLTDLYAKLLEKSIQSAPSFWLWTHNRWKRTKEEWLHRQEEAF
ncbi:MAG: lysophospholipid acyltransferase family protein [Phocaeicola sp.]|uniref:lysophospholipid acyltransferase family protein n=1 Tax=Phocaeicola sp. TaxID=2773926 RepID=UPI003FA0FBC0